MIVTDCGTSRGGVGIFIALENVGDRYVAGAVTLTISLKLTTCIVTVRDSTPDDRGVTDIATGAKPSSSIVMVCAPGVSARSSSPVREVTPAFAAPARPP